MPSPTIFRYYPGTLAAGAVVDFECFGDYVFLLSNTGAAGTLEFSFGNIANQVTPVGLVLKTADPFTRLTVKNNDVASASFVVIVGKGDIDYKALVIGNTVTVSDAYNVPASASVDAGSQVTLSAEGQIFAASTTRLGAIICNPATNTGLLIRFDGTTVTTSNFAFEILPGVVYEIPKAFLNLEVRGLMRTSGQSCQISEV